MGLTRREFLKATGAFIASNAFNLPSSLAKPKEKKIKKFYLTIDDGPSHYTHLILSALFELGWKATFFVIGKQIDKYKKQLKEVLLAGHEVGNHSWSHPQFSKLDWDQIEYQIKKTDEKIRNLLVETGKDPKKILYFRYPYGDFVKEKYRRRFHDLLEKLGYFPGHIGWDIDTRDWKRSTKPSDIMYKILNVGPKKKILIHERLKTTEVLLEIAEKYRGQVNKISIALDLASKYYKYR